MDVSIIIVNYNTLNTTKDCLDSIQNKTKDIEYEIILVDNASTDGSIEFFQKFNNLTFIKSDTNLGFGRANNLGLKKASGKYIFLLNSDTILLNNAIKLFYNAMEAMPDNIACLGTKLLAQDGITENNSYGTFPSIKSISNALLNIYFPFTKSQLRVSNKDIFEVDYIIGADLFIKKKVIDELGLFDPDFFMYFEESNMQLRYHNAGYRNIIISTPKIVHLENASDKGTKKFSFLSRKRYFESMFIYMKKRYSTFKYLSFRMLCIAYLPIFFVSSFTIKEKTGFIKLFFKIK